MTPRIGSLLAVAVKSLAESQFLTSAGELALRISGPGQEGTLVRIRSPKCTIGSAAGCTLRLRARGVRGLQCWILRGPGGTVIRRLSSTASLNGAHFDEAMLAVGDRLNIGPVEMVVEELGNAAPIGQIPTAAPIIGGDMPDLEAQLDQALEQIRRLQGESRQGFESSITAADRADQLRDALSATNQQLEEVCGELTTAQETIERQANELVTANEQLTAMNEKLTATSKTVERQASELAVAQQKLAGQASELAKERAKAAAMQTSRESESEGIDQLRVELTTANSERDKLTTELRRAQETMATERASWQSERTTVTLERDEQCREVDALKAALAAKAAAVVDLSQRQSKSDAAEAQLSDLRQQAAELQAEAAISNQELEEALANAKALQQQLSDQANVQGSLDKVSADLAAKCRELEEAQAEAKTLRQQLCDRADAQICIDQLASDLEVKSRELEQAQQQIASLTTQAAHAGEIAERAAAVEHQQAELGQRESQVADSLKAIEEKQAMLTAEAEQLAMVKQMLTDKERRLSEAALQIEQAQTALLSQQERIGELDQRADKSEAQSAEIATRMAELDGLLERLVDERAALASRETDICSRESSYEERFSELHRQAEQFQARREQLDEREAQLAEREAAAIGDSAHDEPRRSSDGNNGQTLCMGKLPLADAANVEDGEPNADELYKTIVADSGSLSACRQSPLLASLLSRGEETAAEKSSDSAEVNSVLGRLVNAGVWKQDEQSEQLPVAEPMPPQVESRSAFVAESIVAPESPRPAQPPASNEEESIETYMQRLMQRVRGDSPISPPAPAPTAVKPTMLSSSAAVVENVGSTLVTAETPQSGPEAESAASEVAPRRPAPDLTTNLSAMRELANSAAQAAINQHARKKTSTGAHRRLWGACTALVGSAVLSYFSWEVASAPGLAGAAVGCTIAAYWLLGAAQGFIGLKRTKQDQTA